MGKRGPQPKGEYGRKIPRTAVLSTRLQPDTRARLSSAAKANNRSVSQELEHRLRKTFFEDDKVLELFGTEKTAAICRLIGATIHSAAPGAPRGAKDAWLKNQALFDDVMLAIEHVLLWFRPGGVSGRREITLGSSTNRSDQLIKEIRDADPAVPITKRSKRQHAMATLKSKLGDSVSGPHPYDEWREMEPPIQIVATPLRLKRTKK